MSLAVGAVSSSKNMGMNENKGGKEMRELQDDDCEIERNVNRNKSESSLGEEEEDEEGNKIQLGPQFTLKEQLEKDKDDESLRKWKEQLLGSVDITNVGGIDDDTKFGF